MDDYLAEYEDGRMTAEAKAIYEAILENGPPDTVRLRREARISAQSAKARFDRALVELQVGLKALPIGVARTGGWNYAFTYELFQRWFAGRTNSNSCTPSRSRCMILYDWTLKKQEAESVA